MLIGQARWQIVAVHGYYPLAHTKRPPDICPHRGMYLLLVGPINKKTMCPSIVGTLDWLQ
jgi:hypothetical protein